jgi:transcriptional regulator with XRE-family HTH domain
LHIMCGIGKVFRMKHAISPAQSRAARALVGMTREGLAGASGVPSRTVADFELGSTSPRAGTMDKIVVALESAGVEFIPENGGGPGVRLRKGSP